MVAHPGRKGHPGCGQPKENGKAAGRGQVTHFLWDVRGKSHGKGGNSNKMVPMTKTGAICSCPSCVTMMPVVQYPRLLSTRLLMGMGGQPAGWLSGGLYTCFSSL